MNKLLNNLIERLTSRKVDVETRLDILENQADAVELKLESLRHYTIHLEKDTIKRTDELEQQINLCLDNKNCLCSSWNTLNKAIDEHHNEIPSLEKVKVKKPSKSKAKESKVKTKPKAKVSKND